MRKNRPLKSSYVAPCGLTAPNLVDSNVEYHANSLEPRHEKTGFLHIRKQRRRSFSR